TPRAPEGIVGTSAQERRGGDTGRPARRVEFIALEAPDRRMLVVFDRLPGRDEEAERDQPLQQQIAVVEKLPAFVVFMGTVRAGAERRANVLKVMTDDASAVLDDDGVERVAGLHV